MFKKFQLTFTKEVTEFIKNEYQKVETILEYGSGGSTIFGASQNKTVITTESSSQWLIELMGSYKENNLPGDIIPIYSNVGDTKAWGYPENENNWKEWYKYSKLAWLYCKDNNIEPDLVLIDGRFRVSCFFASCICTNKPIRILFDDFIQRPHYFIVKDIIEPSQIIDNRLAVFDVKPNMITSNFLLENINFFYDPS